MVAVVEAVVEADAGIPVDRPAAAVATAAAAATLEGSDAAEWSEAADVAAAPGGSDQKAEVVGVAALTDGEFSGSSAWPL
mmetsp:Transcript_44520/g.96006  ORF Transcript_44520/g.96006 Transcript_44520/m.96006 type:complete len:80 (+) Transcript_44520:865-1104(+)